MKVPEGHKCLNCENIQDTEFEFCPVCGQKNTDGKITFSELWAEFQDAVFNIESRTWRTFISLLKPGKLTNEYFTGKHRRFVHPLRLLIVTSLLLIVALSFQDVQSSTNHGFIIKDKILENYERQQAYRILDNITDQTNASFPDSNTTIITDTILNVFEDSLINLLGRFGDRYGDSINVNSYMRTLYKNTDEHISKKDFLHLDEEELIQTYKKNESFWNQLVFKQKIKYLKDESQLSSSLLDRLTLAILLMMPFVAFVLYLMYYKRGFYYIENLIFTFHIHSFSFLVLTVWILGWSFSPEWVRFIAILIIQVYLFMSIKKVYRQGFFWTLLKFVILNAFYLALLLLFLYMIFWISFLLL